MLNFHIIKVDLKKGETRYRTILTKSGKGIKAQKREQILGAALSVLANWPEPCKNHAGEIEATKIKPYCCGKKLESRH